MSPRSVKETVVHTDELPEEDQLAALTPEVVKGYADGDLSWSHIRSEFGVLDFGLMLRRLGEQHLRLPRASADRPTAAREWLRQALAEPMPL